MPKLVENNVTRSHELRAAHVCRPAQARVHPRKKLRHINGLSDEFIRAGLERHDEILGRLQPAWRIADYNLQAATLFAKLRRDWRTQNRLKDIRAFDLKREIADSEKLAQTIASALKSASGGEKQNAEPTPKDKAGK